MKTLEKLLKQDKDISGQSLGRIYLLDNLENILITNNVIPLWQKSSIDMDKWQTALHWIEQPENISEKVIYYRYVSLTNWLRLLEKNIQISYTYATTVYRSLLMEVIAPLSCIGTADAILRTIPILTTEKGRDRAERNFKIANHELVRGLAVIQEGTCTDLSEDGTAYQLPDNALDTVGGLWVSKYENESVTAEIASYMEQYDETYKTLLTYIATLEVFAKKLGVPELALIKPQMDYLDSLQVDFEDYKETFIELLQDTPYISREQREAIRNIFKRGIPTSKYATFKVSDTARNKAEKLITRNLNHFQDLDFEKVINTLTL